MRLHALLAFLFAPLLCPVLDAQTPPSGSLGIDVFAVSNGPTTNLSFSFRGGGVQTLANLPARPSRWLHRRRHLPGREGAIATDIGPGGVVLFVAGGVNTSTGRLSVVDVRTGLPVTTDLVTNAPAAYDPLVDRARRYVFVASDDGQGGTVIDVIHYGSSSTTPSVVASPTLAGAPAAWVSEMRIEQNLLLVPTTAGVHILDIGPTTNPLTPRTTVSTMPLVPTSNLGVFSAGGTTQVAISAATFGTRPPTTTHQPLDVSVFVFDLQGNASSFAAGSHPTSMRDWVPAMGSHDPGVVAQGGDAYVAFLLHQGGDLGFSAPGAIAVLACTAANGTTFGVVPAPSGDPFARLSVSGTRMAFLTSSATPDSEQLNVLYTPLDPLGAATAFGVVGHASSLGGRVSVETTDRPHWSRDGRQLLLTTSSLTGATNPGLAGTEMLEVPAGRVLRPAMDSPTTLVPYSNQINERAYGLPAIFVPTLFAPSAFGTGTLFGQFSEEGANALLVESGQTPLTTRNAPPAPLTPRNGIPGFQLLLLPNTFDDVNGPSPPPPIFYGARRATFNLLSFQPSLGLVYMLQAADDRILLQATGFGLAGIQGLPQITIPLPPGSLVTTEILSL